MSQSKTFRTSYFFLKLVHFVISLTYWLCYLATFCTKLDVFGLARYDLDPEWQVDEFEADAVPDTVTWVRSSKGEKRLLLARKRSRGRHYVTLSFVYHNFYHPYLLSVFVLVAFLSLWFMIQCAKFIQSSLKNDFSIFWWCSRSQLDSISGVLHLFLI